MVTPEEQRRLLVGLKEGGGYGMLFILSRPGDVLFAASPVPELVGYEIVCASPDRKYDIWKDGHIVKPNLEREQVRAWIQTNTPEWLYDDSEPTELQKQLVGTWFDSFMSRYPGIAEIA